MITDAILQFFLAIGNAAYNALPAWTATVDSNSISTTRYYLQEYNQIAPVAEMITWIGIYTGIFGIMYGYKAVVTILNLIRGAGA